MSASPDGMISSKEAITLLVSARGNPALAAARAKTELGIDITEPLLLAAIASDPRSPAMLYQQLQLLMVLESFDTLRITSKAFREKLPTMSPDTLARTYTKMLDSINQMTTLGNNKADTKPQADQLRTLLEALPPEVADAVEALMVQPTHTPQQGAPTMAALQQFGESDDTQQSDPPPALEVHPTIVEGATPTTPPVKHEISTEAAA